MCHCGEPCNGDRSVSGELSLYTYSFGKLTTRNTQWSIFGELGIDTHRERAFKQFVYPSGE